MVQARNRPNVYTTATRFVDAALRRDDSLFTPGRPIWRAATIEDLYSRFVEHPDGSDRSFVEKLQRQLHSAPADTVQLMGEVLYFHFLVVDGIHGETKRKLINEVLGWSPDPVSIPPDLQETLEHGVMSLGAGFNMARVYQLTYILEFARAWKRLPDSERHAALEDPWRFKQFVDEVPIVKSRLQRNALLHLVHPETFEHIGAPAVRARIVKRYADLVKEPTADEDRQLYVIRRALSEHHGKEMNFYDHEIRREWEPDTSKWGRFIHWSRLFYEHESFDREERDYKLEIAEHLQAARTAIENGADDWLSLLKKAFGPPNNLTSWRLHGDFLNWCAAEPTQARETLRALWNFDAPLPERLRAFSLALPKTLKSAEHGRTNLASFLHMVVDPTLYPIYKLHPFKEAFELTGFDPPAPDADEGEIYEHALRFLDQISEEASARGLELRDRLDAQGVLWAVLRNSPEFLTEKDRRGLKSWREMAPETGLGGPDDDGDEDEDDDAAVDDAEANGERTRTPRERAAAGTRDGDGGDGRPSLLRNGDGRKGVTLSALAKSLSFDEPVLARMVKLLETKGQIVFHGPPGTGKTFVARELARTLTAGSGRYEIVQFHPSYAYEDFVEGYRPDLYEGHPGFKLKEGPLKRIARDADANPGGVYILIIDELNRGNLAKVFGELYFLLEYRKEEIRLQYSEDPFSLPRNLWFIGTMNTADRSIALVDAALRRRFHFFPFFPDEPPVQGLLRKWLRAKKPDLLWLAEVVDRANAALENRHSAIGPSYFMRADLDAEWVELIWEHSVMPYLQEQFFGEESRLKEFGLGELRGQVGGGAGGQAAAALEPAVAGGSLGDAGATDSKGFEGATDGSGDPGTADRAKGPA